MACSSSRAAEVWAAPGSRWRGDPAGMRAAATGLRHCFHSILTEQPHWFTTPPNQHLHHSYTHPGVDPAPGCPARPWRPGPRTQTHPCPLNSPHTAGRQAGRGGDATPPHNIRTAGAGRGEKQKPRSPTPGAPLFAAASAASTPALAAAPDRWAWATSRAAAATGPRRPAQHGTLSVHGTAL